MLVDKGVPLMRGGLLNDILLCPKIPAKLLILQGIGRQQRKLPCRGVVRVAVKPGGIVKMGVVEADSARRLIHELHKVLFASPNTLGDDGGGIVSRAKQQSVKKLLEGIDLARFEVEGGTLRPRRPL